MRGDAPFHAHVYFEPAERETAAALRERLRALPQARFVGPLRDGPVGPHPLPQFEIHFLASALPRVKAAIAASGLRALVHPLTDDDLADHTTLAQWIGDPLALDESVLDPPGRNQGVGRFGKSDF